MKKMRRNLKKRIAYFLVFCMSLGVIPNMPDNVMKVSAASNAPSVTAYADKNALMASFDLDGTDDTVGKIVFGKNTEGNPQEWYIAGQDGTVEGDNIILWAASPLGKGKFNSDQEEKEYSESWGCVYPEETSISSVYSNHYGGSEIRAYLISYASDVNYFSAAEQELMNATKISTYDDKNSKYYATEDKLYLLNSDEYEDTEIAIDVDNRILVNGIYCNTEDENYRIHFTAEQMEADGWMYYLMLRTPSCDEVNHNQHVAGTNILAVVRMVAPSLGLNQMLVGCMETEGMGDISALLGLPMDGAAIVPAFNLDLTNVLFASAVPMELSSNVLSGNIANGSAMTLRMDGKNTVESKAYIDGNEVKVIAASGENIRLVVQGNDGTTDWYYTKEISGTSEIIVKAEDIKGGLDLSTCEIWVEKTGTDGLIYAKNAKQVIEISSVAVTDIDTPIGGTTLDTNAVCATEGIANVSEVTWVPANTEAAYSTKYSASVTLTPEDGYVFSGTTVATINGAGATATLNDDGTLTVTKEFDETAKPKLLSITEPEDITGVANGTEKTVATLGLPTSVAVSVEGNGISSANVSWDLDNLVSGSYDPAVLTEQTFTVKGTVTIPNQYDLNNVSTEVEITVTVNAAGVVATPTADVVAGTYTENQNITLSTSTAGADIYYTTDGSTPGKSNGTKYTGAIAVTGTAGESVTTTIKAIAVKDGMQDSSVADFTYQINLPKPKLLSITEPEDITGVANGTKKTEAALGLPTSVAVSVEGNGISSANVSWDLDNLVSGSYDPTVLTEQTFTVMGTVQIPSEYDLVNVSTTVSIDVTVAAAGVVGVPTVDVAAGTYTENQNITLSTSTAGADIYYTTDGSTPGKSNGTKYTGAIAVTGTAGESVTTTIKAIAVKDGMQDSSVAGITYIIELPIKENVPTMPTPPTEEPEEDEEEDAEVAEADVSSEWDEVPKTGEDNQGVIWLFAAAIIFFTTIKILNKRENTKDEKRKYNM